MKTKPHSRAGMRPEKSRFGSRWLTGMASVLCALGLSSTPARAAGGDISIDFAAAAPYQYNHAVGGGAFNTGANGKRLDIVESLEGADFACGERVTYLLKITVKGTPSDPVQSARISTSFLADSTGKSGVALHDVVYAGINYGPVVNGKGESGVDYGMQDDGGSLLTQISKSVGPLYTAGSTLDYVFEVSDLEPGEVVIVRLDVELSCDTSARPTGNLQGSVTAGLSILPDLTTSAISVGNQTIPFLRVGGVVADKAVLTVTKTVMLAEGIAGTDDTDTITVPPNTEVRYVYKVENPSTGTVRAENVVLVDDNGTPGFVEDDFTVTLTGLTQANGGDLNNGILNYLNVGNIATGVSDPIMISGPDSVVNVATAAADNAPSVTDTATVVVSSTPPPPPPPIPPTLSIVKTVKPNGTAVAPSDELTINSGVEVEYLYTVSNSGGDALNVTLKDDMGTPEDPNDDRFIELTGLSNLDSGEDANDLAAGATATGRLVVTLSAIAANTNVENTATASASNDGLNEGQKPTDKAMVHVLPVCQIECPNDVTVELGLSTEPEAQGFATSANACTVTHEDIETPGTCPGNTIITRTWTAACAGFVPATCIQTITVEDTTGPTIIPPTISPVQAINIDGGSCGAVVEFEATATDLSGTVDSVTYSPESGSVFPVGTTQVTVTATDACGNESTAYFDVVVLTSISGTKFYDLNANGVQDSEEPGIQGWKITLSGPTGQDSRTAEATTDINGHYTFNGLVAGDYQVSEIIPLGNWKQTTLTPVSVALSCPATVNLGSSALGAGGGLTIGYWSNKNGESSMKRSNLMSSHLSYLTSLNLRDGKGANFDPTGYPGFNKWLLSATADNMSYMLSAQLSAMSLNVRLNPVLNQSGSRVGGVDAAALVYAPGVNGANNAGFIQVVDLIAEANAQLLSNGVVLSASPARPSQERIKNALDQGNNNRNFLQLPITSVNY